LKREEAISVLKELLDCCVGLDGHYFELSPPYPPAPTGGGYQIVIHATLDEQTTERIKTILTKHQLAYQTGSMWKRSKNKATPDTFIIYSPI
jgi:hypothetical protein